MRNSLALIAVISAWLYINGKPFDEPYTPIIAPSHAKQDQAAILKPRPRPVVVVADRSLKQAKAVETRTEVRVQTSNAVVANTVSPDRPVAVQKRRAGRQGHAQVLAHKAAPSSNIVATVARAPAHPAVRANGNRVTRWAGDVIRPVANDKMAWNQGKQPVGKPINWMVFGDERLRAHRDNGLLAALAERDEPFLIEQYRQHNEDIRNTADRNASFKAKRLASKANAVRRGARTIGTRTSGKSLRTAKPRQQRDRSNKYAAYSGRSTKKFGFSGGANGFTLNW